MKARQIEAMLDYLEVAMDRIRRWADDAEPTRDKGLCIGTSRTAILALRQVGVRADALPVKVTAYSPAYLKMVDRAHELGRELTADEVLEWHDRGAWAIHIGPPDARTALQAPQGGGFNGHVIVAVQNRWIIDLTLGQASRPERGIPLPATAWADCPSLARRQEPALFSFPESGVQLTYELLDDRSFTRAHDWTHARPNDPGVRGLADRLRQVAAGQRPAPFNNVPLGILR